MRGLWRRVRPAFLIAAVTAAALAVAIKRIGRADDRYRALDAVGFLDWGPSFLYAFGFACAFLALRIRRPVLLACSVVAGATIYEALQAFMPERTVDPADFVATAVGLAVALAWFALARRAET